MIQADFGGVCLVGGSVEKLANTEHLVKYQPPKGSEGRKGKVETGYSLTGII
jgi:hypothetical protein